MKTFLATLLFLTISFPALAANDQSVFDRVIKSGTIRCGYFSWYPAITKDPNTGQLSGIFYDFMNEVGKTLSLKVEWTEEIGLGDYPAALESGRIDAMCAGSWMIAERSRAVDFISPLYYLPLYAFVQTNDTRFDKDISLLNSAEYTIGVLEGGATATIRRKVFPDAKPLELPQLTSPAELFTGLAAGKSDAVIYDMFTYNDFNKHNPGQVRKIIGRPLKVFPNVVAIKQGEEKFRRMLNHAYTDIMLTGTLDKIIDKYEIYPGSVFRAALPYKEQ